MAIDQATHFHHQAVAAMEAEDFAQALELSIRALVLYQAEGNNAKFAEVVALQFLLYNHLQRSTGDKKFQILAGHSAEASLDLARASGDKTAIAIPAYNLFKHLEGVGKWKEAREKLNLAIKSQTDSPHSTQLSSAILADMKVRLALLPEDDGSLNPDIVANFEAAIKGLEDAPHPDSHAKNAWVAGNYIRAADLLADDDKAREYLAKAKAVIDSDPTLSILKKRWEELNASFSS